MKLWLSWCISMLVMFAPLLCGKASAEEVIAKCVSVPTGNHCIMRMQDRQLMQVRLWGVERIEGDDVVWMQAQSQLSSLVQNKAVTLEVVSRDSSGLCYAKIYVADTYVNCAMLWDGLLRLNQEQAGSDADLQRAEADAKKAGNGHWANNSNSAPESELISDETPAKTEGPQKVTVSRVIDGDTLAVVTEDGTVTRICLYGCDAPEKGQYYWNDSRDALLAALEGKSVTIIPVGKDERDMKTARIYADGVEINRSMIEQGYGAVPPSCEDKDIREAEAKATRNRLGMWIKVARVLPWTYRQIAAGRRADAQRRLIETQQAEREKLMRENAYHSAPSSGSSSSSSSSYSSGGSIHVKGYYRKDGTYVRPHSRRRR